MKNKSRIQAIKSLVLPPVEEGTLAGGIPYYFIRSPYPGPCKIELIFQAGRPQETIRLSAYAANSLLGERTAKFTGPQIAQRIDYYGASLQPSASFDLGSMQLLCSERHLVRLIPLLMQVTREVFYREEDLRLFVESHVQDLQVDLEQTDAVSYRLLTAMIFGEDHPYGYNSTPELYRHLTTSILHQFHRNHYLERAPQILIMGHQRQKILRLLERASTDWIFRPWSAHLPGSPAPRKAEASASLPGKNQVSLKTGRIWPGQDHPDYAGLLLLNTLVGGYFGSRLVQQVREKKGYTYNIYSSYESYRHGSFFFIGCETSQRKASNARQLIRQELDLLQQKPVPEAELQMVKNYLAGQLSSQLDNALIVSDWLKQSLSEGSDWRNTSQLLEQLLSTSGENIRDLAQVYLDADTLTSVMVG